MPGAITGLQYSISTLIIAFIPHQFITMLIIGVLSFTTYHTNFHIIMVELLLVRYSNACLRLFCCLYYKIYIVYRDFITTLIIGVLKLLLVRYGNACLRLFFTRFTLLTEILSQC